MSFDEVKQIIQAFGAGIGAVTVVAIMGGTIFWGALFLRERSMRISSSSVAQTALTLFMSILPYLVKGGQIPPEDAEDMKANAADPVFQALIEHFNREELEVLASNVGLDLEYVPDGPLPNIALRLKRLAERTGKRASLVEAMKRARPGLLEGLR